MHKKILLGVLAAAALAMAAPSMASATTTLGTAIPALGANDDQAYIADGDGNPEDANITASGTLNLVGGVTIVCSNNIQVTVNSDGTATVGTFTPSGCTVTGFPSCSVAIDAENLDWGGRLVYDTGSSPNTYKLRVNVAFNVTFLSPTPNCPVTGTFTESGTLSPDIAVSGGSLTATFTNPGSGTVSSPLGSAGVTGTLTSTGGVGSDTQLIHD